MDFGTKLKEYRKKAKLTQVKLAEKSGFSRTYLSDVENNRYKPSVELVKKIADTIALELQSNQEDKNIIFYSLMNATGYAIDDNETMGLPPQKNKPTVREHINSLILDDDFHEKGNPIQDRSLEDTISCFEDSGLDTENMDVATIYLNNINFYEEKNNYIRIHDKKSYLKYLNLTIKALTKGLENEGLNELYTTAFKNMIEMNKRTIEKINQSK